MSNDTKHGVEHVDKIDASKMPLTSRRLGRPENWHDFLHIFYNGTSTVSCLTGLLHNAWDVSLTPPEGSAYPSYTAADRIVFFLTVAHGWCNSDLLKSEDDCDGVFVSSLKAKSGDGVVLSQTELRMIVARKAYEVLCRCFFDPVSGSRPQIPVPYQINANQVFLNPQLHQAIMAFFVSAGVFGDNGKEYFPNLEMSSFGDEHRTGSTGRIVQSFIRAIYFYTSDWNDYNYKHALQAVQTNREEELAQIRRRIASMKLLVLRLLCTMRDYEVIESRRNNLGQPEIDLLIQIAENMFVFDRSMNKKRKVTSIAEAFLFGSREAEIVFRKIKSHESVEALQKAFSNAKE